MFMDPSKMWAPGMIITFDHTIDPFSLLIYFDLVGILQYPKVHIAPYYLLNHAESAGNYLDSDILI